MIKAIVFTFMTSNRTIFRIKGPKVHDIMIHNTASIKSINSRATLLGFKSCL